METHSLDAATWFWLLAPMCLVVLLSVLTFFAERRRDR